MTSKVEHMDADGAYFAAISEAECRALLGEVDYGRIAWQATDGITVVPVNFQLVEGHVVFHTSPRSPLAELVEGKDVAFQVDDVDEEVANGWSVLLRGTTGPAPSDVGPTSWLTDGRTLGIMIEERRLSGRAMSGQRIGEHHE